jgi:hypothetical protein
MTMNRWIRLIVVGLAFAGVVAQAQVPIRQSTSRVVRIGPAVAVGDGFTPVASLTLSGADEAEALRAAGAATLDISGATFAAVTGSDGWYNLTLDTTATNTVGDLTVVVNDDSLILPLFARFTVLPAVNYDALYVTAPGAAGGLLQVGTNADFDVTANASFSGGITITQSTSNTAALVVTGNGTGNGATFTSGSGATGNGLQATAVSTNGSGLGTTGAGTGHGNLNTGGATGSGTRNVGGGTSGAGLANVGTAGNSAGIANTGQGSAAGELNTGGATGAGSSNVGGGTSGAGIVASSTSGNGITATAGGGNGSGIAASGNGTGGGVTATAGATGNGFNGIGGATSGAGIRGAGTAGNSPAMTLVGQGSAAGLLSTGGATGHGASLVGGATSGNGLNAAAATSGIGINATGVGTTQAGLAATGGSTSSSGILATGGGTGSGVRAVSGGGATGDGITAVATSTNGNGLGTTATGTGSGIGTGAITNTSFACTGGSFLILGVTDCGTAQSADGTGVVLRSAAAFADDTAIGQTLIAQGSTQGYAQSQSVTDNALSGDAFTVDGWTVTPSGTISYYLFGTAPFSSGAATDVNVISISGDTTAADNLELFMDGTGYAGGTTKLQVNATQVGSQTASASGTVTFPGTIASSTNITGGTITTTTNLTNLPAITANWLTATGIASDAITNAKVSSDLLPNAAPAANGGLPTVNASNYIAGLVGTLNTLDALDTAQDSQHSTTQSAIAALNDLATADLRDLIIEDQGGGVSLGCALSVLLAYAAGDITTTGGDTDYEDPSGTEERITGTVSSPGNRAASISCPTY